MKRLIMIVFLVFICISVRADYLWEEPGIWANQTPMLHAYDSGLKMLAIPSEDGFFAVWVESLMGVGQIFGQKYLLTGASLWDEPIQFTESEYLPLLQAGCQDNDGNLILGYTCQEEAGIAKLLKVSSAGEVIWEQELESGYDEVWDLGLRPGSDDDFYLCFRRESEINNYVNEIFRFDAGGEVVTGWENGICLGSLGNNSWDIDEQGNLVIMYVDANDDIYLQKYQQSGLAVFEEPIFLFDNVGYDALVYSPPLAVTPSGDYLCCWENIVLQYNSDGELMEQYINNNQNYDTLYLVAGEEYFYTCDERYNIYQFEYGATVTWQLDPPTNDSEILALWLSLDERIRFLDREFGDPYYIYEYALFEYDTEGELYSPPQGWCSFQAQQEFGRVASCRTLNYSTAWLQLNRDSDLQQNISFRAISPTGEILSGIEPVVVTEGVEWRISPLALYVNEDMQAIVLRHTGERESSLGNERIILQRLDRQGQPLGSSEGITICEHYGRMLSRRDNQALFFVSDMNNSNRYFQLIDLETGEFLWGEEGLPFYNPDYTTIIAGDIYDGGVTYFWQEGEDHRAQHIVDGEEQFPLGGVPVVNNGLPNCNIEVAGLYLINYMANNHNYRIHYLENDGTIAWSENAGSYLHEVIPAGFELCDEGLLYIFMNGFYPPGEYRVQLLNADGEFLFGEGISLPYEFETDLWGLIIFEDSFGVLGYQEFGGEPAIYCRYAMDGTPLAENVILPGMENSAVNSVQVVDDGFVVFMTEPAEQFNTLKYIYFDQDGNLQNITGNNPNYYYLDYCATDAVVADVYDNDVFFSWQTRINNFNGIFWYNEGNDVLMQSWIITVNDEDEENLVEAPNHLQLMPNPFNPELMINWTLAETSTEGQIVIYNIKGQKVWQQAINSQRGSVCWQGMDKKGDPCSSGIYMISLQNGKERVNKKALLLK